ncbi:UDP-N-acetylmuramoyl-tripeptide--D-alanyl-D-alanine ligase [Phaeocystidibacter luteus]|uniref:UDP-N-acetylmuramoyl-tripeptide--D-alanyl-D-alanine ligase n=1 Tax=Phaeocystidibacter luteus TaxID=911197 RepID=A0A6N6RHF3_9FLAO|nr:UDP-N-acetylmuramoyl-tripeptide--D-alanyl-D-alanine ligase [Phaeocystidibacter luteus]KAB2813796.1 UDP-N-acetylmuramoyl-tripeptide--D-alanyl-D-alanine ligase [Phaeocystidibacter luteus]
MNIEQLYSTYLKASGVNTDTRSVSSGEVFFALKGPSFNGNKFAAQALEAGAIAVVVDEEVELPEGSTSFKVKDVLTTLQELAKHHRNQLSGKVIGLTGSNGKTTAKELFKSVLSQKYDVKATVGNLNNHIGVPLTILRTPLDTEYLIVEMGANHQGEIALLSSISQPDIGYITNFGKAHLEGFGGIEGVIKGKSELYKFLRSNKRVALVNHNDTKQMEKSEGIERITYGSIDSTYPMSFTDINFPASVVLEEVVIQSQLTGSFHAVNIGAAVALGLHLGLSSEEIVTGVQAYKPTNNRSEWRKTDSNRIMLDAYNANPSSMSASIISFIEEAKSPKVLILGDMFELGEDAEKEHQAIVDQCAKESVRVILVGEHFAQSHTPESFEVHKTTTGCLRALQDAPIKHSTILLKGSRGMQLESLLAVL